VSCCMPLLHMVVDSADSASGLSVSVRSTVAHNYIYGYCTSYLNASRQRFQPVFRPLGSS
jgi:hypothetical protein